MAESVDKKSRYVYSDSDFAIISEGVSAGNGYRAVFAKYVTNRKYGAKKWSLGGVKKVAAGRYLPASLHYQHLLLSWLSDSV